MERAAELAAAFDRAFAAVPPEARGDSVDILALRIGGDPFALRIAETAGLFAGRRITPVPTTMPEFRGIAGLRGAVVPVYDLGALVGYPPAVDPRWLVLAREAAVAFAFDGFERQLRVAHEALVSNRTSRLHVHEVARDGGLSRLIIHLPSVFAALRARTPADG
jgi:purine-binding chemotaxis protein CheW